MHKKNSPLLQSFFTIGLLVVLGLSLGIGVRSVKAWVAPSANPPSGNVAAPITTGGVEQTKTGGLSVRFIRSTLQDSWFPFPGNSYNYLRGHTFFNGVLYDEENTAYYLNPSAGSTLNALTLNTLAANGSISADGGKGYLYYQNGEGEVLRLAGSNGQNMHLENINGTFRLVNHPWNAELFSVNQNGYLTIAGKAKSASTASGDAGNTLVTKDYVDAKAGAGSCVAPSSCSGGRDLVPDGAGCYKCDYIPGHLYGTMNSKPGVWCKTTLTKDGGQLTLPLNPGRCTGNTPCCAPGFTRMLTGTGTANDSFYTCLYMSSSYRSTDTCGSPM